MTATWATAFLTWLGDQPLPLCLGQLRIDQGWRLSHADDDPPGECPPGDLFNLARFDAEGEYRPLATARDLVAGWRLEDLDDAALVAAIEAIYPAALALWHAAQTGRLRVLSWREVQRRQTGQYGLVKRLDDTDAAAATEVLCGDCVRRRLWAIDSTLPVETVQDRPEIPCYEPCSVFVSLAREMVGWRRGEQEPESRWMRALAEREAET